MAKNVGDIKGPIIYFFDSRLALTVIISILIQDGKLLRYPISALGAASSKDSPISDLSRFLAHDTTDHVGTSIVTVQDHDHHPAVITLAMEPSGDDHYLSAVNHDEDDLDHRDHLRTR